MRRRAVIARQIEYERVGPRAQNLLDQAWGGAVESVNRLVRVANAKQVGVLAGHLAQQRELEGVHVLGLVHREGAGAVTKRRAHR